MAKANPKRLSLVQSRVHLATDVPDILHQLVWGRIKSGKTKYLGTAPKPLVVFMAEAGTMSIKHVPGVSLFPLNEDGTYRKVKWKDAYDFLYLLRYGEQKFKSVGVDTISTLTRLGMRYILKDEEARDDVREPGTPDQRTWGRLQTIMTEFMEELESLCKTQGMHLIYTCHERKLKEEAADQAGVDVVPDLSPGIRSVILKPPDIISRTFIEEEESDDIETEGVLKYGMIFQDPELEVGFRDPRELTKGMVPLLPRRAFNVTVPKIISRIEKATRS